METEILQKLFPGKVLSIPYPAPWKPSNMIPEKVKAIVLGCDPSNFSQKDGTTKVLETVFAISGKGKDRRYFSGILKNLEHLGLSLDNIYVQNLCRNYFYKGTCENEIWKDAAKRWRVSLRKELDELMFPKSIPVFFTSECLYEVLIKENIHRYSNSELYENPDLIPIKPEDNYLDRPLIPLFRGGVKKYKLSNQTAFRDHVIQILSGIKNGKV